MELFDYLYYGAALLYLAYGVMEFAAPRFRNVPLGLGIACHLGGFLCRAYQIWYFPLTNKFESFYAFALAVFALCLALRKSPSRFHRLGTFGVGAIFYAVAAWFPREIFYPPPLMLTIWYPLHVPASFLAYALWTSAAFAGIAGLAKTAEPPIHRLVDEGVFWGQVVFSLSMVFGGAWGYVAWGAYFLWDPKVVWSVILWLFYSGILHLKYWPVANRPRVRAVLAGTGFLIMLVAYVGTSFLFGHGSHSFG